MVMTQPCEPCAHRTDELDLDIRLTHALWTAENYERCDTCPFDWHWMTVYGLTDSKATLSAARVLWLQIEALWQEVGPTSRRKVRPMPEDIEPRWWDVPQPERKFTAGLSLFERVKAAVRIEDIAERLTTLHGTGNLLKGKCPLHNEQKGEAFAIYLDTQTWRCFGSCVDGGDVVSLVQECLKRGIEWQKK
jgi:hypothetical protein